MGITSQALEPNERRDLAEMLLMATPKEKTEILAMIRELTQEALAGSSVNQVIENKVRSDIIDKKTDLVRALKR